MTQKNALDILKLGKNVFLTGAAGSGKTYVLNEYIAYLKKNAIPVAVTASTGIAATHMNGKTIHSWAHIGIKDQLSDGHFGPSVRVVLLSVQLHRYSVSYGFPSQGFRC